MTTNRPTHCLLQAFQIIPGDTLLTVGYVPIGTVAEVIQNFGLANATRIVFTEPSIEPLDLMPHDSIAVKERSFRTEATTANETDVITIEGVDHRAYQISEHGQEWLSCKDCGAQWSIGESNEGRDYERVSDGDGYCEDQPITIAEVSS